MTDQKRIRRIEKILEQEKIKKLRNLIRDMRKQAAEVGTYMETAINMDRPEVVGEDLDQSGYKSFKRI